MNRLHVAVQRAIEYSIFIIHHSVFIISFFPVAHRNAGNGQFARAFSDERARFLHRNGARFHHAFAAHFGDDAIRTLVVAAVLNFQNGALARCGRLWLAADFRAQFRVLVIPIRPRSERFDGQFGQLQFLRVV